LQGFKKFLMQGNVIVAAVGLVVALAFSGLVTSFTTNIITPLVNAVGGGKNTGLGFHVHGQLVNIGAFISGIIYFVIFMAVVYFVIVVPYKAISARRGATVFGDPPPVKTCPYCLSADLPAAATKCKYCGTDQPAAAD